MKGHEKMIIIIAISCLVLFIFSHIKMTIQEKRIELLEEMIFEGELFTTKQIVDDLEESPDFTPREKIRFIDYLLELETDKGEKK